MAYNVSFNYDPPSLGLAGLAVTFYYAGKRGRCFIVGKDDCLT